MRRRCEPVASSSTRSWWPLSMMGGSSCCGRCGSVCLAPPASLWPQCTIQSPKHPHYPNNMPSTTWPTFSKTYPQPHQHRTATHLNNKCRMSTSNNTSCISTQIQTYHYHHHSPLMMPSSCVSHHASTRRWAPITSHPTSCVVGGGCCMSQCSWFYPYVPDMVSYLSRCAMHMS